MKDESVRPVACRLIIGRFLTTMFPPLTRASTSSLTSFTLTEKKTTFNVSTLLLTFVLSLRFDVGCIRSQNHLSSSSLDVVVDAVAVVVDVVADVIAVVVDTDVAVEQDVGLEQVRDRRDRPDVVDR